MEEKKFSGIRIKNVLLLLCITILLSIALGFTYGFLLDQIIADAPEVRMKLESLLRYIERSIPLNQLYVDLNNDEKIENDTEIEEAEMRKTLEQMLSAMPSSILRLEMLEKLEHTEPFCMYPDVLHDLKAKEEN